MAFLQSWIGYPYVSLFSPYGQIFPLKACLFLCLSVYELWSSQIGRKFRLLFNYMYVIPKKEVFLCIWIFVPYIRCLWKNMCCMYYKLRMKISAKLPFEPCPFFQSIAQLTLRAAIYLGSLMQRILTFPLLVRNVLFKKLDLHFLSYQIEIIGQVYDHH